MGRRLENSEKSVRNFEGEEADEEAKETEKKKNQNSKRVFSTELK